MAFFFQNDTPALGTNVSVEVERKQQPEVLSAAWGLLFILWNHTLWAKPNQIRYQYSQSCHSHGTAPISSVGAGWKERALSSQLHSPRDSHSEYSRISPFYNFHQFHWRVGPRSSSCCHASIDLLHIASSWKTSLATGLSPHIQCSNCPFSTYYTLPLASSH